MNRIKEFLEAKGMSQTELAYRLGKCFNTVNLYVTNKVTAYTCAIRYSSYPSSGCA